MYISYRFPSSGYLQVHLLFRMLDVVERGNSGRAEINENLNFYYCHKLGVWWSFDVS